MQLNGGARQACGRAVLGSAQHFPELHNLGGWGAQRVCRSPTVHGHIVACGQEVC